MILKNKSFLYLIFILFATLPKTTFTNPKKKKDHQKDKHSAKQYVQNITTEDGFLSLLDQSKPAVVLCSMDNCPHCQMISPIFEKKASLYKKVAFYKANGPSLHIHDHVQRETKGKFKIPGYPVFLFIKNKKIDNVLIGASKDKLDAAIKDFVSNL